MGVAHGEPSTRAGAPLTLAEVRDRAAVALPRGVWDFIEGGAGEESTLRENTEAFSRVRMAPSVLTGVIDPDPSVEVFGQQWTAPVGVAPMAYHTMVHPEGEAATVRAAGDRGLPVVVGMFSGRRLEELAGLTRAPLWLQLYVLSDPEVTFEVAERAAALGFGALVLTADTPRLGRRLRDLRNGFRLPPGCTPVNLPGAGDGYADPARHSVTGMHAGLDWSFLERLKARVPLPLVVKGVLSQRDARLARDHGADAVLVSNHGGRQLDGVRTGLDALPEVADAVGGDLAVFLDGGVRRGRDIMAALTRGAEAVFLGRPVLHGLATGGEEGVSTVLDLLAAEFEDAMLLTGRARARDLPPHASAPPRGSDGRVTLAAGDLHGSVTDPLLDTMNFLNEITQRYPDAISFGPGRPHEDFFDTERLFDHLRAFIDGLREKGCDEAAVRTRLFQYGPTAGMIRERISAMLARDEGVTAPPESVVVTVGCQEAVFLVLRALFPDRRHVLFVPEHCYVGITGAARLLDLTVVGIRERHGSLDADDLRRAAARERANGRVPRACYVVPDAANPTGATMSREQREELLAAARESGLLLIEDSPYRLLTPGERPPSLKALDTGEHVIQVGSFAKTAFPGARVGYAVADQRVLDDDGGVHLLADDLARVKSMVTVNTPAIAQAVIGGWLAEAGDRLEEATLPLADHYGKAMRHLRGALDRHLPQPWRTRAGVSWNRPDGGFFLALGLPVPADDALLARSAERYGVIWTPMRYFRVGEADPAAARSIRLSCSYLSLEEIDEGVARLSALIRDLVDEHEESRP